MNTKIVLGTAAARGLEQTPLMLDMARVGKLIVCSDDVRRRRAALSQIVHGYVNGVRHDEYNMKRRDGSTVWFVCPGENFENEKTRTINNATETDIYNFLDELAAEYERRTAHASMDGGTPDDALFVVIDNLGDIVRLIDRCETQGLLQCFGPGDTDYPAHGIYLIAGLDIDTLGFLGKKRFQLYNCLDHFSVAMMVGDELTGDKKRTVCDFFGERVGTMIADGTATQNAGFLIDFINHPTPFVYQAR